MKNLNFNNFFFIFYGYIKKLKKFGKMVFLELIILNKKININIKKNFSINKSIIGLYGIKIKNFVIYEICVYKKKINNFNNRFLFLKNKVLNFIKNYFLSLNYIELDIPLITKFSKFGSKQFLIIDKKKKNHFYSLSQSPQEIKQFYMFNNIFKYYNIAKCFRDEDDRSIRSKEFLQLDLENSFTSFISMKKNINYFLNSIYYYFLKKKIFIITIKYKKIKKFFFEKKNFTKPYIYKKIKFKNFFLLIFKSIFFVNKIKKTKFFFLKIKKYFIIISKKNVEFYLFYNIEFLFKKYNFLNLKTIIIWVVNFNYYKNNNVLHHLYTSYKNFFKKYKKSKSLAYDIIINGIEIGGGSVRNIDFLLQKKNLYLNKSLFLNFYKKSIPQHCGIALGIERLISILFMIKYKNTFTFQKIKKMLNSIKI